MKIFVRFHNLLKISDLPQESVYVVRSVCVCVCACMKQNKRNKKIYLLY